MRPLWLLPREVLLLIILAELIASHEGRGKPQRSTPRPRETPSPNAPVRAGRAALCGRRPRG